MVIAAVPRGYIQCLESTQSGPCLTGMQPIVVILAMLFVCLSPNHEGAQASMEARKALDSRGRARHSKARL